MAISQEDNRYMQQIFMDLSARVMSEIYSDEDFPVGISYLLTASKMIIEINYNSNHSFKDYKIKNIRKSIEDIAKDFSLEIASESNYDPRAMALKIGPKTRIKKLLDNHITGDKTLKYTLKITPNMLDQSHSN